MKIKSSQELVAEAKKHIKTLSAQDIKKLNENVDIPIIGEGTEEKILEALYETIEAAMKEVLFKDEEVEAAE